MAGGRASKTLPAVSGLKELGLDWGVEEAEKRGLGPRKSLNWKTQLEKRILMAFDPSQAILSSLGWAPGLPAFSSLHVTSSSSLVFGQSDCHHHHHLLGSSFQIPTSFHRGLI